MEDEKIINLNPRHIESVEFRRWAAVAGMPEQFSKVVHVVTGRRFVTEYETEAEFEDAKVEFEETWSGVFGYVIME